MTEEVAVKLFAETYTSIKYILGSILNIKMEDYIDAPDTIAKLEKINIMYETLRTGAVKTIQTLNLNRVTFSLDNQTHIKIPCPTCAMITLASIDKEQKNIKCYFCYAEYKTLEECFKNDQHCYISDEFLKEIKYRKEKHNFIFDSCPACGTGNLVYIDYEDKWICLDCLEAFGSDFCEECGSPIPGGQGFNGFFMEDGRPGVSIICKECYKFTGI